MPFRCTWLTRPRRCSCSGEPSDDFLHESVLVSNDTAVFRVSGLAPSAPFVVTLIVGNFEHCEIASVTPFVVRLADLTGFTVADSETAHTEVVGSGGAGFLADKSAAGYWQHRAFAVNSSAEGMIDFRLGSNNTGAIYQTQDNPLYDSSAKLSPAGQGPGASFVSWMVAGLLVQTPDQAPTPQAHAQLLENEALAAGALRNWEVAGPIFDPDKDGLAKPWPVELSPNQASYPGIGWGGGAVSWRPLAAPTGTMVALSLAAVFEPSQLNSSIAYVKTSVVSQAERKVQLVYSASQAATVLLNHKAVDTKFAGAKF